MNYLKIEEILIDDSFWAWYYHSEEKAITKWEKWAKVKRIHRTRLMEAVLLVKIIQQAAVKKLVSEQQIEVSIKKIRHAITVT